jgi:hypothetical protein
MGEEGLLSQSQKEICQTSTKTYPSRSDSKFDIVKRPPVFEEEHVGFVRLIREHPDNHMLREDCGADEGDRGLGFGCQIWFIHALNLKEGSSQTVCLANVLRRMDVLDPCSIWDAIEVEMQGQFGQRHMGLGMRHGSGEFRGQVKARC